MFKGVLKIVTSVLIIITSNKLNHLTKIGGLNDTEEFECKINQI